MERAQSDWTDAAMSGDLAHGEEDEDVPIAMSRACAEAYIARGSTAEIAASRRPLHDHRPNAQELGEGLAKGFLNHSYDDSTESGCGTQSIAITHNFIRVGGLT